MCHDAAMDTSAEQAGAVHWGAPTEISSYEPTAPPPYQLPDGRFRAVYRRRLAASLVILGFAMAVASQLLPWASVSVGDTFNEGDFGNAFAQKLGMSDGLTVLLLAYLILWLPALALPAACVFSDGPRQRVYFACGAAALAAQTLVIVPVLAKPVRLVSGASLDQTALHGHLLPGAFLAVSAVASLALASVLAIGGRVFPTLADLDQPGYAPAAYPFPGIPSQPGPENAVMHPVDMHAALASSQGYRPESPDIDFGTPAVIGYEGNGFRHPDVPVDHSMYVRPTTAEEPREVR